MIGYCPICDSVSELSSKSRDEKFNVRGEKFTIKVKYLLCGNCGGELEDPEEEYDPLDEAFREYRKKMGMVQPEEIRKFRKKYKLSQQELSRLLGFGGATLSRYENGALQDEVHDKLLRLIMDPYNFMEIIQRKTAVLDKEKKLQLIDMLNSELGESIYFFKIKAKGVKITPNVFNGYQHTSLEKILKAVSLFCFNSGVYKTKLNKLLFYADFKHFKDYQKSITGLTYAHLPLGPCPESFETLFEVLLEEDKQLVKAEEIINGQFCDLYRSTQKPDLSIFSESEYLVLDSIIKRFDSLTATQMVDFSHKEECYIQTSNSERISYDLAKTLSI